MDPEKHMTPNGGTTSLIANYPLVPHTKPDVHALRQLAMQERAIRWLSFWRRACTKASVWQRSWPAGLTDHITLTGEDLLAMVIAANDHRTQLTLSATCTSLRGCEEALSFRRDGPLTTASASEDVLPHAHSVHDAGGVYDLYWCREA